MQPQQVSNTKADDFKPKYRHFHPQSVVWVQNPFSHDVVYQVADEYNRPYQYRLPAGKVSELPGGMIATLGIKEIVDELIQNSKEDIVHIWETGVRQKYEDQIIMRFKEAPEHETVAGGGAEVNLGVRGKKAEQFDEDAPEEVVEDKPEEPFPNLVQKPTVSSETIANLPAEQLIEED